jgi:hypothetical protein
VQSDTTAQNDTTMQSDATQRKDSKSKHIIMPDSIAFSQIMLSNNKNRKFGRAIDSDGNELPYSKQLERLMVQVDFYFFIRNNKDKDKKKNKGKGKKFRLRNAQGNPGNKFKTYEEIARCIFTDGFSIRFSDKKDDLVEFVRFEKSASMARENTLTFIAKDISEEVSERVTLGLSSVSDRLGECVISKWQSYKGLCLSSATRVDVDLDADNVVVIPDFTSPAECRHYLTARKKNEEINGKLEDGVKKIEYELLEEKDVNIENINHFDGLGLISFDYAKKIAGQLYDDKEDVEKIGSFQFRLPFCKGMLHKLDFKKFLREEMGIEEIVDIWGKRHPLENVENPLKNVQIILTQSQFKAMKWFNTAYGNDKAWHVYWENFNKYKHSLFIVQTNRPDAYKEANQLNYQVLHTLDISKENFQDLLSDSMDAYAKMKFDYRARLIKLGATQDAIDWGKTVAALKRLVDSSERGGADDEDELQDGEKSQVSADSDNSTELSARDIALWALRRNALLIGDDMLRAISEEFVRHFERDLCVGHFLSDAKTLFLCSDLIKLLGYITKNSDPSKKFKIYGGIPENGFFAPAINNEGDTFSIIRNPHISRNEHVTAKCLIPKCTSNAESSDAQTGTAEIKSKRISVWYKNYCGHLTGVCMINPKSLFAERLSGADYDGDFVKVIQNETFVNAAKHNLPIIKIPGEDGGTGTIGGNDEWCTLKNTFSSNVGKYTNYAFSHAARAYANAGSKEEKEYAEKRLNLLTILVGLEIDSAKTGIKPVLTKGLSVKENEPFLHRKEWIKNNINKSVSSMPRRLVNDMRVSSMPRRLTADTIVVYVQRSAKWRRSCAKWRQIYKESSLLPKETKEEKTTRMEFLKGLRQPKELHYYRNRWKRDMAAAANLNGLYKMLLKLKDESEREEDFKKTDISEFIKTAKPPLTEDKKREFMALALAYHDTVSIFENGKRGGAFDNSDVNYLWSNRHISAIKDISQRQGRDDDDVSQYEDAFSQNFARSSIFKLLKIQKDECWALTETYQKTNKKPRKKAKVETRAQTLKYARKEMLRDMLRRAKAGRLERDLSERISDFRGGGYDLLPHALRFALDAKMTVYIPKKYTSLKRCERDLRNTEKILKDDLTITGNAGENITKKREDEIKEEIKGKIFKFFEDVYKRDLKTEFNEELKTVLGDRKTKKAKADEDKRVAFIEKYKENIGEQATAVLKEHPDARESVFNQALKREHLRREKLSLIEAYYKLFYGGERYKEFLRKFEDENSEAYGKLLYGERYEEFFEKLESENPVGESISVYKKKERLLRKCRKLAEEICSYNDVEIAYLCMGTEEKIKTGIGKKKDRFFFWGVAGPGLIKRAKNGSEGKVELRSYTYKYPKEDDDGDYIFLYKKYKTEAIEQFESVNND